MDDLISRKEAIAAIQNLYPGMPRAYGLNRWHEENDKYIECEEAINKLPSIKPKKGKWMPVYKHFSRLYTCSCCGEWRYHPEPYCGQCGADMRKEKSDE